METLQNKNASKDVLIEQLQDSIQQLEKGLEQISTEAQVVIKKNSAYKKEIDDLKAKLINEKHVNSDL